MNFRTTNNQRFAFGFCEHLTLPGMKIGYLFTSAILLILWVSLGSITNPFGSPLPRLGAFFNPGEGFWSNTENIDRDRRAICSKVLNDPRANGTVFFDDRNVPHVFASNLAEASYLQGYVHAADRLWQMDVSTRATEGRLSEVLGRRTYARDLKQIRTGYRRSAQLELDTIREHFPEDYAIIEAYSAGVNAYVDQLTPKDYAVEYKILGHEPIRWSPYRSILLMKGMSQALSSRYRDAEEATTRDKLPEDLYQLLFPKHQAGESPVVPDGPIAAKKGKAPRPLPVMSATGGSFAPPTSFAPAAAPTPANPPLTTEGLPASISALEEHPDAFTLLPPDPGNGSNNWAVSANHSNTGYPMLASDPHLALTLPSIWYEIQIHLPEVNARGVSLPGAPGIMIGYNDHVAYGETNVGQDVTDWFKITWVDVDRREYLLDGERIAADYAVDTLVIKGEDAEVIRTPWTVFGPVPEQTGPYADHAMRYLGHEAIGGSLRSHSTIGTFMKLMRAENLGDYENALSGYVDPAQNFVYADRHGEIALRPNGFFPVRPTGDGGLPYPGDRREYNWRGYVPFDQRPMQRNPERGFVASANQITTGTNFPYAYNGSFDEYRGRFINRRLERESVMNQRTMKELQLNSYSLQAEEITPLLLARLNRNQLNEEGTQILRLVADWDYRHEGNSRAATFFQQWKDKVYELTFDELSSDSINYLQPDDRVWTELIRKSPGHVIFDIVATTNFRETAATLVQRSFEELLDDLNGQLPAPWATARDSRVRHLGAIPGLGSGLITTGGGRSSPRVLMGGHGASWRMVVELGKHPRAWGALPGGASGHPASEAYDNGLENWTNGRYHELDRWRDWEEAEVKSAGRWEFRSE
ncbi:penicillin acylase family protein [Neolewinella antarctica]|uniref:Penicillin amidase n=1 Tax=Neolewinella antarctica TaxID=442734 RepID=A0ABX0XCB7_9BACT|nr:penicillin acylase family protein [Neolewinella antarctica]NJC26578.1 penicillin amidase [Neolewinella antarctica]